jgi:hypothetical protein
MLPRGPMSRTALLLSSLFVAACTVGELPTNRDNPGPGGGSNTMPDAAMPVGNGCVGRVAATDAHLHTAGNTDNAGKSCMVGGCHLKGNTGTGASAYQFAGTVYKADGVTPNPGVNIRIKPANGGAGGTLVSDKGGNFSAGDGSIMMAFPATTDVSACPTIMPMSAQIVAGGGGNCNGCHAKTGGTTTPISLPD